MYVGYLQVKANIDIEVQRTKKAYPGQPPHQFVRPIVHNMRSDLEFDFVALHFLLESERGQKALDALHDAEHTYRS